MLIEKFEDTGISISARFESEIITLGDAVAIFKFLDESIQASLRQARIGITDFENVLPEIISNVSIESGSIKTLVQFLRRPDYQVGIAASLTSSLIWAVATHPWSGKTEVETNVPVPETIYRIPIDPQITAMANAMNQTGKPWSIELGAKDPRFGRELRVTIRGNQTPSDDER
jgi:hypothetical protein